MIKLSEDWGVVDRTDERLVMIHPLNLTIMALKHISCKYPFHGKFGPYYTFGKNDIPTLFRYPINCHSCGLVMTEELINKFKFIYANYKF